MAQNPKLHNVQWPQEVYIRWATRADIPEITRILYENLLDFEFFDHFCLERRQHPDEFYGFVLCRVRMFFVKPGFRHMVAEKLRLGPTGHDSEILGFSTWDAQRDHNPLAAEWKRQDSGWLGWLGWLESTLVDIEGLHHRYARNTCFDYRVFLKLRGQQHDAFAECESLKSSLHLQYLMVAPKAQGHGVGHRLLQWGLDVAAQLELPVVLESSLAGYPFYLKRGFKVMKEIRIDANPHKAYNMPLMVYDPKDQPI